MDELFMFSKAVCSGEKVELYVYSQSIKCGHERGYDIVRRDKTVVTEPLEKRRDNMLRSRQRVRHIIWSNMGRYTKFVTLTYAETVLDQKRLRRDITTFVQAMRRLGYDMKYLYVLEHQTKRGEKEGNEGCLHVHMVLFIEEYIQKSDLEKCWKYGWVDIHAIDDVLDLGAYVCKYITKENSAEFNAHVYGVSRGLKRPQIERFYTDGLSDTTTGLHPQEVLDGMDVSFKSRIRHDYRDNEGAAHELIVNYYQGTWRDGDVIEQNNDETK